MPHISLRHTVRVNPCERIIFSCHVEMIFNTVIHTHLSILTCVNYLWYSFMSNKPTLWHAKIIQVLHEVTSKIMQLNNIPYLLLFIPAITTLWGSASLSVRVACRKEPVLAKLVPLSLNCTETASFSLFCFFSRQIANAHPTAWLNLSPCNMDIKFYIAVVSG